MNRNDIAQNSTKSFQNSLLVISQHKWEHIPRARCWGQSSVINGKGESLKEDGAREIYER